jgi:molybdate transport system substrate-binding protein
MLPALGLALGLAFFAQERGAQPITVSAAISLSEAMQAAATAYEASGGNRVVLNFAASNVLSRQIVNGARVDVFISADARQMALVEKAGLVAPRTLVQLLGNQLAIVSRKDRPDALDSPASLAAPGIRRIAIGDPEAVPAGVYARQYLERVGLWQALQPKLLPTASVRAALATVENGGADAGIVYVTDARAAEAVRVTMVITGPDAPAIVYPACVVSSSTRTEAAARFLTFLQTPAASRIFLQHGFLPLASSGGDSR